MLTLLCFKVHTKDNGLEAYDMVMESAPVHLSGWPRITDYWKPEMLPWPRLIGKLKCQQVPAKRVVLTRLREQKPPRVAKSVAVAKRLEAGLSFAPKVMMCPKGGDLWLRDQE